MLRVIRAVLVVVFVTAGLVAPSTTADAAGGARSATLTTSSRTPTAGQTITLKGTVHGTAHRRVRLQRWTGHRWQTLRTTTSSRRGAFTFRHRADAAASLRATAPAVKHAGRRLPTRTSPTLRLRPVARAVPVSPPAAPAPVAPAPSVSTPTTSTPTTPTPSTPTPTVPTPEPEPVSVLPRVDVTTSDGEAVTSKDTYSTATLAIDPRGSNLPASAATPMRIRVRGNVTSWISIKYPFKIKTDSKQPFLGMPTSKNWVLLANFFDRSMLRNQVAFEASRRIGLPWTPRTQSVELWINGGYRGLYQLAENVEAEAKRVVVPQGGHLLEADSYPDDTTPSFRTPRGVQVFLKNDETAQERDAVAAQVATFENTLYSDDFTGVDGWAAHADVDSFVDWYLVNEFTKNIDSSINNSVWMTIDADGRLSMGPVWDFDFSAGNRRSWGIDDPTGWFVRHNWFDASQPDAGPSQIRGTEYGPAGHWYIRMFQDPAFEARVRARWAEVSSSLSTLPAYVTSEAEQIAPAAARNFEEGSDGDGLPIGPTFLDPEPGHVFTGSWEGEVDLLKTWIGDRWTWMDQQLTD